MLFEISGTGLDNYGKKLNDYKNLHFFLKFREDIVIKHGKKYSHFINSGPN